MLAPGALLVATSLGMTKKKRNVTKLMITSSVAVQSNRLIT